MNKVTKASLLLGLALSVSAGAQTWEDEFNNIQSYDNFLLVRYRTTSPQSLNKSNSNEHPFVRMKKAAEQQKKAMRSMINSSTSTATVSDFVDLSDLSFVAPITDELSLVRYSAAVKPAQAAQILMRNNAFVAWAQPDYWLSAMVVKTKEALNPFKTFALRTAGTAPNGKDPTYDVPTSPEQKGKGDARMNELWGMNKINAPTAWHSQKGSKQVVVADIDTGVDYTHEDMRYNMWVNPNPQNGDLVGYDFVENDAYPFDEHAHGTHTSATIAGSGDNGVGVTGVVQDGAIMALRFLDANGSGRTSAAIQSIDYAIWGHARIMSNSWGGRGGDNRELTAAVKRAADADILFVAAAGNDGSDNDKNPPYPAGIKLPNVLAVAATDSNDGRAYFSNYGAKSVHVGAPGKDVLSAVPGGYESMSGTSMACPHVAGLAAMILSENPKLHAIQVKEIIMQTVDQVPDLQGITVTGGRINAAAALEAARRM